MASPRKASQIPDRKRSAGERDRVIVPGQQGSGPCRRTGADSDGNPKAEARGMLTAAFAHELRTPLAILKGRLHGLEDGIIDPSTGECERLLAQVDRVLHVVDSLGTLVNARSGELIMDWRSADLAKIVSSAMNGVSTEADVAQVGLRVNCEPISADCDPVRFAQALTALARAIIADIPAGALLEAWLTVGRDGIVLSLGSTRWRPEVDCGGMPLSSWVSDRNLKVGQVAGSLDAALAAALFDALCWSAAVEWKSIDQGACVNIQIPFSGQRLA